MFHIKHVHMSHHKVGACDHLHAINYAHPPPNTDTWKCPQHPSMTVSQFQMTIIGPTEFH